MAIVATIKIGNGTQIGLTALPRILYCVAIIGKVAKQTLRVILTTVLSTYVTMLPMLLVMPARPAAVLGTSYIMCVYATRLQGEIIKGCRASPSYSRQPFR